MTILNVFTLFQKEIGDFDGKKSQILVSDLNIAT